MRLTSALRSTLGLGVLCGAIALPAAPALAVGPVVVVGDTANAFNWLTQLAHMGTITADDLERAKQIQLEINDADQELNKIGSLSFDAAGAMQTFGSYALAMDNQYPLASASLLADSTLRAQNGVISPDVINRLRSDMLNANGNLAVQQALANIFLVNITQNQNSLDFAAAQEKQRGAAGIEAAAERGELLDVNEKDPTIGMLY